MRSRSVRSGRSVRLSASGLARGVGSRLGSTFCGCVARLGAAGLAPRGVGPAGVRAAGIGLPALTLAVLRPAGFGAARLAQRRLGRRRAVGSGGGAVRPGCGAVRPGGGALATGIGVGVRRGGAGSRGGLRSRRSGRRHVAAGARALGGLVGHQHLGREHDLGPGAVPVAGVQLDRDAIAGGEAGHDEQAEVAEGVTSACHRVPRGEARFRTARSSASMPMPSSTTVIR